MPRRRTPTLLAAIALALAGCGSSGSDTAAIDTGAAAPKINQNQTVVAAEEALYRAFAAHQSGDMRAAYSTLTKACQQSFGGFLDFEDELTSGLASVEALTGSKISEMKLGDVSVVEFTPERATFSSSVYFDDGSLVTDGADGEPDVMVYEDGEWRSDCAGSLESEMKFETVGAVIEEDRGATVTTTAPKR